MLPLVTSAQWRIGVIGGAFFNYYEEDNHYLVDANNKPSSWWGPDLGISGYRSINEWQWLNSKLGVQVEMQYVEKNHITKALYNISVKDNKGHATISKYGVVNSYLQIPIMLNYSAGWKNIRAFVNAGGFGGLKLRGNNNKTEFGGVGGLGFECDIKEFTFQLEGRGYFGATNTIKTERQFKTPHYNTSVVIQAAVYYNF